MTKMLDKDSYNKFFFLIADQFTYGGKKYALATSDTRESTDMLFDKHGKNWLIGTMDKYTYRYSNLARERDLLKIACYCYIMWLKRGYHITPKGIIAPPIDTNVKMKEENFNKYADLAYKDFMENQMTYLDKITFNNISGEFGRWSNKKWEEITSEDLITVLNTTYVEWFRKYSSNENHDTDTK
jgi:hypothetical protein